MMSQVQAAQDDNTTATDTLEHPFFSTTLHYEDIWGDAGHLMDLPYYSPDPHTLLDEIKSMLTVVREAWRADTLVLDSSNGRIYPDVLACILIGFMPRSKRPAVALVGDMWQPNDGLRGLLESVVVKLSNRAIDRYFLLSSEELEVFPKLWGIDPNKMRVLPYYYSFSDEDLAAPTPPPGDHIFAGGNTNRDYRPLVEVARQFPDREFILATRRTDQIIDPPPNITARQVSHEEFVRLMRAAKAVVLPARIDLQQSIGQQTYLNAMYLKKPTIVPKVFGVADHITAGKDAIVIDGSVESYADALRWVLDPANEAEVEAMKQAAHETARDRFSVEHYVENLVALARELALDRKNQRL